jgi:cell division initiation protein
MIDLTPLDVRKKRGDFKKAMRGYETQEVDTFLDLVAERMEELVKETLSLRERSTLLQAQVEAQGGREKAVQDALVTAQSLRDEIKEQARREADIIRREAESESRRLVEDALRQVDERRAALADLERKRERFLMALRRLLERELDLVSVEEGRTPLDDAPVDLELQGGTERRTGDRRSGGSIDEAARRTGGGAGPVKGELWLGLAEDAPGVPEIDPELAG